MATRIILLSEALKILHSGAVCSLTYVTADYKRGTGGQLVFIPACVIYNNRLPEDMENTPTLMSGASQIVNRKSKIVNLKHTVLQLKNPHHHANKTRNIYIPKTRQIKKLHIKLITEFNGHKVLL